MPRALIFFFSSRRRHTRFKCDWSSDVCSSDLAYTIFAQPEDRSGYARGTLAPKMGMTADVPPMDQRPMRTMVDMGMGKMAGMKMGGTARVGIPHVVDRNKKNMPPPSKTAPAAKGNTGSAQQDTHTMA